MERAHRHCPLKGSRFSGKGTRRRPSRLAPRARTYTSFNSPALMNRTRTFHSAGVSRTTLLASPMRTSSSSISTLGHASHLGQRETVFVMVVHLLAVLLDFVRGRMFTPSSSSASRMGHPLTGPRPEQAAMNRASVFFIAWRLLI